MTKDTMKYKGYIAKVEFSAEDRCLHGKIDGISDLVTFEATDATEIEKEFHDAVDDYLVFCSEIGKTPDKYYSGSFNVRLDPAVHKSMEFYAIEHRQSLNAVVAEACSSFIRGADSEEPTWVQLNEYMSNRNNSEEHFDDEFESAA